MNKKQLAHALVDNALVSGMVAQLVKLDRWSRDHLRIFTYHRLGDPAIFEAQMRYLAERYYVASMAELLDAQARGDQLPPRSVMVTFDDAYEDFARVAWPILKRYKLPVTVFVATAYPDQPQRLFWWDRLEAATKKTPRQTPLVTAVGVLPLSTHRERRHAYTLLRDHVKRLPHEVAMAFVDQVCCDLDAPPLSGDVLGWDALRQLAREGVTLGAHTQTHPLMNRISPGEAVAEAEASQRDLEREIGSTLPIFAYPNGSFNEDVVAGLHGAGFKVAFTTGAGANRLPNIDWMRLRRNNISPHSNLTVMQARLLQSAIQVQ